MATKVWLLPLEIPCRRKEQSTHARELLKIVCDLEGIVLAEKTLLLPGLQLIEQFSTDLGLGLSITHSSQMVAIALSEADVGIDCEPKGRNRNWQGIAQQFFTAKEAEVIATVNSDQRESVFLRHWVLKEAYLKALHGSIFGDLNRLVLEGPRIAKVDDCGGQRIWRGWKLELFGCSIAVCSASGGPLIISQVHQTTSVIQALSTSLANEIKVVKVDSSGLLESRCSAPSLMC